MTNRVFAALVCVLCVVRLPSLAEPMGADQALYSYVGDRVLQGDLPYRDAWDQKPPAVHLAYAGLRGIWPHDSSVAAADLVIALAVTLLLARLGSTLHSPAIGFAAGLLFLFLTNPAFMRLSGVTVRAQCETFIAAAVTAALVIVTRGQKERAAQPLVLAGILLGIATAFKYNAVVYAAVVIAVLWLRGSLTRSSLAALAAGSVTPLAIVGAWFAARGGLDDLYQATIVYNLRYSGETYAGPFHAATYLLTFPVRHARVDGLWLLGGAGCALLLAGSARMRERLFPVAWVAAACASIAINGSRDLPQYFVQAAPALALAAAWGWSLVWGRRALVNLALVAIVALAIWRVNEFTNLVNNTHHDIRYLSGQIDRSTFLARYGDRSQRKYSALAVAELAEFLRTRSAPTDRVYVFGFSSGAYVGAGRASASRFFWSRPVIAGFNEGRAGYGVSGVLDELRRTAPAVVALQRRDWAPDVDDSAHFFMTTPPLADWLQSHYDRVDGPDGFDTWVRRGATP
jgi:hypothetical protein